MQETRPPPVPHQNQGILRRPKIRDCIAPRTGNRGRHGRRELRNRPRDASLSRGSHGRQRPVQTLGARGYRESGSRVSILRLRRSTTSSRRAGVQRHAVSSASSPPSGTCISGCSWPGEPLEGGERAQISLFLPVASWTRQELRAAPCWQRDTTGPGVRDSARRSRRLSSA